MHPSFHPLFIRFCTYFNGNQDYFECHEVLEEYWKDIAPGDKEHTLVGFVQLATAMYHWRRGNVKGASRTLHKAQTLLRKNKNSPFYDNIDMRALYENMELIMQKIIDDAPFSPFQLIITNKQLQTFVAHEIKDLPLIDKAYLKDKHMLRDRSAIILEREINKSKKWAKKEGAE